MVYNQIVTWTAFAILAMFLRYKSKRDTQILHTAGQTMTRNEKGKKVGLSLVYPPPHLYHILFELFKNSMRATVETHSKAKELPEIEVLLAKGEHDVSIRISDQVDIFPRTIRLQN